jgi:hypothetical protein
MLCLSRCPSTVIGPEKAARFFFFSEIFAETIPTAEMEERGKTSGAS